MTTTVRIRQQNIGKRIVAHVPTRDRQVVESGTFHEDGVPFGAAEIRLEFIDPADEAGGLLPTGNACDVLHVPALEAAIPAVGAERAGCLRTTLINAGCRPCSCAPNR